MGGLKQGQPAVDEQLIQYLNSLLQQAEAASGNTEVELRSLIQGLRSETRKVPPASTSQMGELEVAARLDQLSAKMESVDKLLKEVENDPDTQNFLSATSELWMPVITATAEDRRAMSSSSTPHLPNPTNQDGTDPSCKQ